MKHPRLQAQARLETPLGPATLAASDQGLAGFWFDDQRHHPGTLDAPVDPAHPQIARAVAELAAYWRGERSGFDTPLDAHGTAFQCAVWDALRRIPPGTTTSYAEIARRVGRPRAVRAVGAAIGRNPVCVVVPCHRVVGSGGALTGYAGGLDRKRALLELERRAAAGSAAAVAHGAETGSGPMGPDPRLPRCLGDETGSGPAGPDPGLPRCVDGESSATAPDPAQPGGSGRSGTGGRSAANAVPAGATR